VFDFENAMTFINSFDKLGKPVSDLNRISALLDILGNPQDKLKFIHIAGTNGKGSVAEMCSQIMMRAGYNVGLFTSPFIVEYSDRIRFNGENIPPNDLCRIVQHIKERTDKLAYKDYFSQFEISTAIAFLYFALQECDIVVLETGIGGLLDSTNVIQKPIVTIITSISYDHTKILGETLEEIATQKAGIIKPNVPCVLSANNPPEVENVIKKVAKKNSAELIIPTYDDVRIFESSIFGSKFLYRDHFFQIKMPGEHQIINAISVLEAMKFIQNAGFYIRTGDIYFGLKNSKVFARTEILSEEPLVILDGAHNQAGMKALANSIKGEKISSSVAIIGMLKDKKAEDAISEIAPFVSEFICVEGFHPNAIPADELVKIISSMGKNAFAVYDIKLAITEAKNLIEKDGLLLMCGSLYLASIARKIYL